MNESIQKGYWYKVESGVHRGKSGVCDLIKTEQNGETFYRLGDPYKKELIGRFRAEQLRRIDPPTYVSKLPQEVQNELLALITKGT